jgi:DNA-binding transcriptional regulator YdaS (Cro superfamily)
MKELIEYFGNNQHEVARQLGCRASFISQCASGKRKLGFEKAMLAEKITNGAIKKESLRPDIWPETTVLPVKQDLEVA